MGRLSLAGGAILALLTTTGACSSDPAQADRDYRGQLTRGGVQVVVRLQGQDLAATFTPRRSGFHVYSVDLPATGVQGLGIATRVRAAGGVHATGGPVADMPVRQLPYPSLGLTLPVYPNGPVTVRVEVERSGTTPVVRVSYAACSESVCLPPVRDVRVPMRP
jgi:hypothetical protein